MSAPATRRVRRMWLVECNKQEKTDCAAQLFDQKKVVDYFVPGLIVPTAPVFVLDLSPAAMDAHVEAMARAIGAYRWNRAFPSKKDKADEKGNTDMDRWTVEAQEEFREQARAALAALMKGRTGAPAVRGGEKE